MIGFVLLAVTFGAFVIGIAGVTYNIGRRSGLIEGYGHGYREARSGHRPATYRGEPMA